MFAVGGNPEAAKVSGVNVIKTQIMVYAIAGMMYAFAAALEVGRIGSASNTTGNGYEMDAVAACVIGGVSLSGGVGSVGGIVIQLWPCIHRCKHVLAVYRKRSDHSSCCYY